MKDKCIEGLWTDNVWLEAASIYHSIINSPFIIKLADGSLPIENFKTYIAQDELYLGNYGRQMFEFAELIADAEQKAMFVEFAKAGLEGEKQMHQLLIERFGIADTVSPSPITAAYNAHTQQAIDTKDKAIALAALLPCMWVYNEVGLHILETAKLEGNPYKEWIEEYGNEEFTQGVKAVLQLADEYAEENDEAIRQQMTRVFLEATEFEYQFWNWCI